MHTKKILVDADVISHFISGGKILDINQIFSYQVVILDKVYEELEKYVAKKTQIDNLINLSILEIYNFPESDIHIKKEFFYIKNKLFKGEGEAACMAVARYTKDIIASSNLSDIKGYCNTHQIIYLTTMDFLCEALNQNIFSLQDCNDFIRDVLAAGSKLPVKKMEDYNCRKIVI
jgi:predicted nucleic acid-binding protein